MTIGGAIGNAASRDGLPSKATDPPSAARAATMPGGLSSRSATRTPLPPSWFGSVDRGRYALADPVRQLCREGPYLHQPGPFGGGVEQPAHERRADDHAVGVARDLGCLLPVAHAKS